MRDSMVIYKSFYEAVKDLDNDTKVKIYDAIYEYGLYLNEPNDLDGVSKVVWTLIKPQLDANLKKYKNGQKGAKHGAKGGRPKKPSGVKSKNPLGVIDKNPTPFKGKTPNVNDNVNDNVNNTVNGIERKRDEFKKLLEPFKEKYTARLLNVFYEYWTASDLKSKKVRFENEKFFDVGRRLASWKRREKPTDYGPTDDGLVDYLKGKGKL